VSKEGQAQPGALAMKITMLGVLSGPILNPSRPEAMTGRLLEGAGRGGTCARGLKPAKVHGRRDLGRLSGRERQN
jgi:hypothetical protein